MRHLGGADSLVFSAHNRGMYTARPELGGGALTSLVSRRRSGAGSASVARRWLRERATTTPGRLILLAALVVAGGLGFGVIASAAERSRERSAQAVRTATEPLLVQAATLYTTLSDANATATTTFLRGGLEPPARHAHYLQDLRAASASLATLTRNLGSPTLTSSAIRTVTEDLPVYSGLVEAARADNRQGFPVGAAYLRQASDVLTTTILPAANRLYATEAERLSNDYGSGTAMAAFVVLSVTAVLALLGLVLMQRYLAAFSRRIFNLPAVAGTVTVAVISIWAVLGFIGEQDALATARAHSDSVEVLSGARVLLSRAQSDQSLTLVNRGSDETDPQDFTAVMRALSPSGGLLGEVPRLLTGSGNSETRRLLRLDFARYRANTAEIGALQGQGLTLDAISRASSVSSTSIADGLQTDLATQIAAAQDRFGAAAADASGSLGGLSLAIPILTAFAAALAVIGLLQRLGEYR
jgi:hypothetical protein